MNISTAVSNYLKLIDKKTRVFYKEYKVTKFVIPPVTSSPVQERMLRLGIENRCLGPMTSDELYLVATATLHEDYMKSYSECIVPIRNIWDVKALFTKQLEHVTNKLYYMRHVEDSNSKLEIVSMELDEYDYILSHYTYAELSGTRYIPKLCGNRTLNSVCF